MPKFKFGAPQVSFRKRDGSNFTQTFHSRLSAEKSIVAWRNKGGKVNGSKTFGVKSNIFDSKSGLTQRSGRATRDTKKYKHAY